MPENEAVVTEGAPDIVELDGIGGGVGGAVAPSGDSSIEEAEAAPSTGGGVGERLGLGEREPPAFPEGMGYMGIPVSI